MHFKGKKIKLKLTPTLYCHEVIQFLFPLVQQLFGSSVNDFQL